MHITFKLVTLNCDYFGYYRLQSTLGHIVLLYTTARGGLLTYCRLAASIT